MMADAAPASPSAAAAEAPVAAADPRLEALAPIGPSSAEVSAVVPSLRAALLETLPADTKLWGAELLNPDDKAGATVLGKCVPAAVARRATQPRTEHSGRPAHRTRAAPGAHARARSAPGSCARAT
jgi:hypothetical protein